jgi:CheY-like chemotaxis protein
MLQQVIGRAVFNDKVALVIEDDAHSLIALGSLLKSLHIQYKRNTTGAKVLQQARRLLPDFVLLDMDLPDGDPFLIRAALRSDPELSKVPIIAIVDSRLMENLRLDIEQNSFAGCLPKPVAHQDFEELLRDVLNNDDKLSH